MLNCLLIGSFLKLNKMKSLEIAMSKTMKNIYKSDVS